MLMTPLLWGGLFFAWISFLRQLPNRSKPGFGFHAVVLIGWMDIFSLMGGFSIGMLVAAISVLMGSLLILFARHYRPSLVFVTTVALLLLLFMRGWFLPAQDALPVLLAAGLVYMVALLWKRKQSQSQEAADAVLAILGLLFFQSIVLGLVFDPNFALPILLALAAVIVGIFWLATGRLHRWYAGFLSLAALVWLANVILYVPTGN